MCPAVVPVGIGLLGTAFMGRAHSRALYLLPTLEDEPAAVPVLRSICGRDSVRREFMRLRFGWERGVDDWRELIEDPAIEAFDNAAPNNLHAEPTIAALRAGKHVICEKPLGRTAVEARQIACAADDAGVVHMCAFNYRFFPAIRLARQLIEEGVIGQLRQFRSRFLLGASPDPDSEMSSWRLRRDSAGSGVVGDLLAHHIDLARHLVGELTAVSAATQVWDREDPRIEAEVEDSVVCIAAFENGAVGTLEAGRTLAGHVLESVVEIDGSAGSILFDVQRLNHLVVSDGEGVRTIDVTEERHPYSGLWWPRGQGIGWGDSFVHELRHFMGAVAGAWRVAPEGATFHDGLRCAEICDAILRAASSGRRQEVCAIGSEEGKA